MHARQMRHRQRNLAIRAATALAGSVLLIAGAAMLLLPGPAFAVIPAGLALLALEFAWAERALAVALDKADAAKAKAAQASAWQRALAVVGMVAAVSAAVSAVIIFDVPVPLLTF